MDLQVCPLIPKLLDSLNSKSKSFGWEGPSFESESDEESSLTKLSMLRTRQSSSSLSSFANKD